MEILHILHNSGDDDYWFSGNAEKCIMALFIFGEKLGLKFLFS